MATAMEYLSLVPGDASADTAVLRDRIFRSGAPGLSENLPQPPFPFISEEPPVSSSAYIAPAQTAPVQQHGEAFLHVYTKQNKYMLCLSCTYTSALDAVLVQWLGFSHANCSVICPPTKA